MDIVISVICLPILLLVMLFVAPVILLNDGRPVFYLSKRRGRGGRPFTMFKFRSMKVDAPDLRNPDGSTLTSAHDPRLTKSGAWLRRTSIDELPQILNIVMGDMSLVGPRPQVATRPYDLLSKNEQEVLSIRPGLTGYNQAYWRNAADSTEKTQNDVYYVRNMSLTFDVRIIWQTAKQVTSHAGVNSNEIKGVENQRYV